MTIGVLETVLLLGMALQAQIAPVDSGIDPQSFYVANFDGNRWMIVDVQPLSAADSKVRFIDVYRACGTFHVEENDYVLEGVSVQQLAAGADVCLSDEKVVAKTQAFKRKRQDTPPWWENVQGIEAQCGTKKVIHHLPVSALLHFETLKARAPRIASLWTLSQDIQQRLRVAGDQPEASRAVHATTLDRRLSEQAAIEIRNGDFDQALPEMPQDWRSDGHIRLSEVMPGPEEATGPLGNFGVVENAEHLELKGDPMFPYPQMALIAHIDGDVSIQIYIDAESGSVSKAVATFGHPILASSAVDAINKWKFSLPYSGANPLTVVVHYKVHCPPTIDTAVSTTELKDGRNKASKK
ncbi:MAG TPA: energy transducer TonB [Candidatus Angelobacter sp.]|nr:energy transducer TonB [Candidatus Angelobacter sp.]